MISKVKLSVICNFIFIQYLLNDFNDEFNRYINEWGYGWWWFFEFELW